MLDLFTAPMTLLLPEGLHWTLAPSGGLFSQPVNVLHVPNEPSTLALALVGIGTMGVYAITRRFRQPSRSSLIWSGRLGVDQTNGVRTVAPPSKTPKRGAA